MRCSPRVEAAIADGTAVAMESTIFSRLGLPDRAGREAVERCERAIVDNGGVPTLIAIITVCAGAKSFLDIARTLEHLESSGVPVLTLGADEFPAFTTRISGVPAPRRVESVSEVVAITQASRAVGYRGGILVAAPIDAARELPRTELDAAVAAAVTEVERTGITGSAVTPFVLERIATATGGRSVSANVALAEQDTAVAAQIAVALQR